MVSMSGDVLVLHLDSKVLTTKIVTVPFCSKNINRNGVEVSGNENFINDLKSELWTVWCEIYYVGMCAHVCTRIYMNIY